MRTAFLKSASSIFSFPSLFFPTPFWSSFFSSQVSVLTQAPPTPAPSATSLTPANNTPSNAPSARPGYISVAQVYHGQAIAMPSGGVPLAPLQPPHLLHPPPPHHSLLLPTTLFIHLPLHPLLHHQPLYQHHPPVTHRVPSSNSIAMESATLTQNSPPYSDPSPSS